MFFTSTLILLEKTWVFLKNCCVFKGTFVLLEKTQVFCKGTLTLLEKTQGLERGRERQPPQNLGNINHWALNLMNINHYGLFLAFWGKT